MKLVIGISGASGAPYAKRLLDFLKERAEADSSLHVDITASPNGLRIFADETGAKVSDYPFAFFDAKDFDAPFASGSAGYDAMAVVPTSGGTLGRIASGASSDLLSRTAEVMLKEKKQLLLVFREAPYSLIHIKNMETLTLAGATVMPAAPSFYSGARSYEALIDTVVARIVGHLGFEQQMMKPWGG